MTDIYPRTTILLVGLEAKQNDIYSGKYYRDWDETCG